MYQKCHKKYAVFFKIHFNNVSEMPQESKSTSISTKAINYEDNVIFKQKRTNIYIYIWIYFIFFSTSLAKEGGSNI